MDSKKIRISPDTAAEMVISSYEKGHEVGHSEGFKAGYGTGYSEGREDGHREGVTSVSEMVAALRAELAEARQPQPDDGGFLDGEPETIPQLQARLFPGVVVPEAGPLALAMDVQIRDLWAAALLSRLYEKGKGRLHKSGDGWCCLGVKCDLYIKAGNDLSVYDGGAGTAVEYNGGNAFPPYEVSRWAGVDYDNNPAISRDVIFAAYPGGMFHGFTVPGAGASYGDRATLSSLNDSDADIPFEHIAWLILGRPDLIAAQIAEQTQA